MIRKIWNFFFGNILFKVRSGRIPPKEKASLLNDAFQKVVESKKYGKAMDIDEELACRNEIMVIFMESHNYEMSAKELNSVYRTIIGYTKMISYGDWIC